MSQSTANLSILILALALSVLPPLQAEEEDTPITVDAAPSAPASKAKDATLDERRALMFQAAFDRVQSLQPGQHIGWADCFPMASALFASGHPVEAHKLAHMGLDSLVPGNKLNRWHHNGNSGFVAWPGIDCYTRYHEKMDDALKARFREIYTGAVFYRCMTTSNHKIMAAVTRYLAVQAWGAEAFKPDPFYNEPDGSLFLKKDPNGEKYIKTLVESMIVDAPGEYASLPYGQQNLLPLLTIADGASDPALRAQARQAYERCILQLAPCWLGGHLATYSLRSYPDTLSQQPWGLRLLLWFYFGGVSPGNATERGYQMIAAVSNYRLPAVAQSAATDRTKPYTHRAFVSGWAMTHFINQSYVLFSRSSKGGKPWFNGQVYAPGVMWNEPDLTRTSQLWVTNPVAHDSPDPKINTNGIHTHGISHHVRQVQREGTALNVFDIPADFRFPYVLGFIPAGARAIINEAASGRIFLHYGSVLVAIESSEPFEWNPDDGMKSPAGKARPGDSEFRILKQRLAVLIETARPDEFPAADPAASLTAFRKNVLSRSKVQARVGETVEGLGTDRDGHELRCVFNGDDFIDGQRVDYAAWPALDNPWMHQDRGGELKLLESSHP